jgi:hypothetical protein
MHGKGLELVDELAEAAGVAEPGSVALGSVDVEGARDGLVAAKANGSLSMRTTPSSLLLVLRDDQRPQLVKVDGDVLSPPRPSVIQDPRFLFRADDRWDRGRVRTAKAATA